MKKSTIFLTLLITAVTATVFLLSGCNYGKSEAEKPLILPDSTSDEILTVISGCKTETDLRHEDDSIMEDELPPEQFIGKIIEEERDHITVCPNTDEKEYEIADTFRISFTEKHKDYLYGTGRSVLITYIPHIDIKDGIAHITTDDINTEGYEDFDLFAIADEGRNSSFVINNCELSTYNPDYNLYYYGLGEVFITVDGKTLPLVNALRLGKVTLSGIISKCNTLAALGEIEVLHFKDVGSKIFRFDNFSILKFHTLDGNRDVYIGPVDMDINEVLSAMELCIEVHNIYGLDIYAKDVSPTGATLVFEKTKGAETGTLQFGESYEIEKLCGSHWEKMPYSDGVDKETVVWHCLAYLINDFTPFTELRKDWSYLYGELAPGTYRIVIEIMDFRKTADYDLFDAYCYFEIKDRCTED